MKLRILDLEDDLIQVEFDIFALPNQQDSYHKQYQIDLYDSPFYQSFKQDLAWYYQDYPLALEKAQFETKTQEIVQKLIKFGQTMADELIGEDFELINVKERIEGLGYPQLKVSIESKRAEFFDEMWEALILPQSNYMLSCVCAEFSRSFGDEQLAPLDYQLAVTPQQNEQMAAMLGEQQPQESVNKPLKVAKWLAQVADAGVSNHLSLSREARQNGEMLTFDLLQPKTLDDVAQLADHHLVHYHGPLVVRNDELYLSFAGDELIEVGEAAKLLVDRQIPCLILQLSQVEGSQQSFNGLMTQVAQRCLSQGLGNVITLSYHCTHHVADSCFSQLYRQLCRGFSLAQAVVEARKALQSNIQIQLVETAPQSFHPWGLLQHYSRQAVKYFVDNAPQPSADMPHQVTSYQKLFGFKATYMPPQLYVTSDSCGLAVLDALAQQPVLLHGEAGSGKTQLAHVLAMELAASDCDWGFYFDLSDEIDDPQHIQQMIAPILSLSTQDDDLKLVDERLAETSCFMVFDGIEHLSDSLREYIFTVLAAQDHKLLLIANEIAGVDLPVLSMAMTSLTADEQHMLLAQHYSQIKDAVIDATSSEWLASVNGHPWLIEKLAPIVASGFDQGLAQQIDVLAASQNKPNAFYQWRWQSVDVHWQRLLLLCYQQRGLLLEMLMIAFDQDPQLSFCQSLLSLLGVEQKDWQQQRMFDAIAQWQQAGMVLQLSHGRVLDPRAKSFILANEQALLSDLTESEQQQLQINFSQLVCEGVRLLATHMVKEPNPNITNNLLANRSQWVKHFETLWFNQDYRGFVGVKQVFDQLLVQAKIGHESHMWAADLIKRSDELTLSDESDAVNEAGLSYLALATSALTQAEGIELPQVIAASSKAKAWLDKFTTLSKAQINDKQLPLFQQVCVFLEQYHARQSNWQQAVDVVVAAEKIYFEHQAWHRVIGCNKSLAHYYHQLEQPQQSLDCEARILQQVPYEGAPAGFKQQQMVDIVLARIGRKQAVEAQTLLEQIKQGLSEGSNEALQLAPLIDGLQCDIYFLQQQYRLAMPLFCRSWAQAAANPQQLIQLKPRMLELKQHIGEIEFEQLFSESTPIGCIHPNEVENAH